MKIIDDRLLATVTERARTSPRRRTNENFHSGDADLVHRFLNAMEPGTYVRPHRHVIPPKWEMFVALAGGAAILVFDDRGRVTQRLELTPGGPVHAAEIPPGTWHTVAALKPGTVLLELKPGPYDPNGDKGFAAWAPAEQTADAAVFEAWLRIADCGDEPPPQGGR